MLFDYNDPRLKDRRAQLRTDQTESERIIWKALRNKQFLDLKFFRQWGAGPYILDFYCPKLRVAIEIDGSQHLEPSAKEYDKTRTHFLEEKGITVIRYWSNDVVRNPQGALDDLTHRIRSLLLI